MARRKKSKGVVPFTTVDVAALAKNNPYIQQLVGDAKLRKNVQTAVASGKRAYGRLSNGKMPQALLEDRRLHADVARALAAARDATITVSKTSRRQARRGLSAGRVVIIAGVGGTVAVVASEKLRSKVLDLLFGAEEEFQYTPPPNSTPADTGSTVGAA
jgi:D-serine deaminase-like pyridoxal phosphate-dependent protein